jgi:amino acid adenylation domain-containing protein
LGREDCDQAIHQRFERQAARWPDNAAIRLEHGDMTYARLNAAANRAARRLLAVLPSSPSEQPIAVLMPQGYEAIVWTLAILKAGLGYSPLDYRLPAPILRAMLEDLRPGAVVAAPAHLELGRSLSAYGGCPAVDADAALRIEDGIQADNLDRATSADGLAYVFYTSGSTGRPKGVADSHRHVLHNILRYTNTLRFAPEDRLSLVQNPSFSGTVSSLFGALLNGASVVPFDLEGDGLSRLSGAIRRARVTVFHAVPSIFRELSDTSGRFPDVRLVRLEGDGMQARDIEHFQRNFQEHCTLVNGLGATECGLVRQFFVDMQTRADPADAVPIGYPVPDVVVKVVDEEGREATAESPGEIVVESRFLATGYWRNPELSSQRFESLGNGVRRYRTGDLGRLRDDGCLIHLGRLDHRVRIAGEFIEPGEIERLLHAVPGIAQAVVQDFVSPALERRLCAYVVREPSSTLTAEHVRQALSGRIGRHAIPTTVMFLEALPLTKDLKVDRGRLPSPDRARPELSNDYVAPATELEQRMAQVWSEVLEVEPVGVEDSFADLGGDSLRAARIVNRLRLICGDGVRIATLFEHPTIRALVLALESGPIADRSGAPRSRGR